MKFTAKLADLRLSRQILAENGPYFHNQVISGANARLGR
jgi:hypothetical protein